MKKSIVLFLLILTTNYFLHAQGLCPPNGISTNPDNPVNPHNPAVVNEHFDWLGQDYTPYFKEEFITDPFLGFSPISPFWTERNNLAWLSGFGTDGIDIDYSPQEGWELITYSLGVSRTGADNPEFYAPYILLYNRYRAAFRLFFNIPSIDGSSVNNGVQVELGFNEEDGEEGNTNITGLFENIDGLSNPLDKETGNRVMQAYTNPVEGGWNIVEFPLAYDPCTCLEESSIITTFASILEADVNMTGLSIGTSSPLSIFNDNQYDDENRLLSVLENGVNPEIGTETYTNLNAWIEKYRLAVLNSSTSPDPVLDGLLTLFSALNTFVGPINIFGSLKSIKDSDPSTFSAVSFINKSSSYLSTQLKKASSPAGNKGVFPQVVEMEMALSGQVDADNPIQSATFLFDTPGTSPSDNIIEYGNSKHPAYPYYNEVLGTFGLLKTPVMKKHVSTSSTTLNQITYFSTSYQLQYDLSSLEYVFNPILDIDFDNTDIYGSYIVETTANLSSSSENEMELLTTKENGVRVYISNEMLPIECLQEATPAFYISGEGDEEEIADGKISTNISVFNVYLRLTVDYQFLSLDRNGNPNRTLQVFTYPVGLESVGNISKIACGTKPSVSTIDLTAFCSDGRYKANLAKAKTPNMTFNPDPKIDDITVTLYPNPTSSVLNINIKTPDSADSLPEQLWVINTLGQKIMEADIQLDTENSMELDVTDLRQGSYFIQIISAKTILTKPFIKTE